MTTQRTTVKVTMKEEGVSARFFEDDHFSGLTPDEVLNSLGASYQGATYRVNGRLLPLSGSDSYLLKPGDELEASAL